MRLAMSDNLAVRANSFASMSALGESQGTSGAEKTVFGGITLTVSEDAHDVLADCAEEAGFARNNFKEQKLFSQKAEKGAKSHLDQVREALKSVNEKGDAQNLNKKYGSLLEQIKKGNINNFSQLQQALKSIASQTEQKAKEQGFELSTDEAYERCSVEAYLFLRDQIAQSSVLSEQQQLVALADQLYHSNQKAIDACIAALSLSDHQSSMQQVSLSNSIHEALASKDQNAFANFEDFSEQLNTSLAFSYICANLNNVDDMMRYMEQKYSDNSFDTTLATMLKTVSAGLNEVTPFSDKASLQTLGKNLSALQQIKSAIGITQDFWQKLGSIMDGALSASGNEYNFESKSIDPKALISNMISLSNKSLISPNEVRSLLAVIEPLDCTTEVLLAQQMLSFERSLSDNLFYSIDSRNRLMAATQTLIDNAIDAEDEYLASLEEEDY